MVEVLIYLLESSVALAVLYLLYVLLLRKETFFSINRFYLLGILVFSLLSPFMSFDFYPERRAGIGHSLEEIRNFRKLYFDALSDESVARSETGSLNVSWPEVAVIFLFTVYVLGLIFHLYKTSRILWRLRIMTYRYPVELVQGVRVVKLPFAMSPFSYMNNVFVEERLMGIPEFDQILAHEKVHIRQQHSADLIFVQLIASFMWFNPLVWQLIKSIKSTHEYIADKKVINSGYSLVEYQTLLLRQLISNNSLGLVHNFNLSFIKKRITMMKNKKSGRIGKVKVTLALSLIVFFSLAIAQSNSTLEAKNSAQIAEPAIGKDGYVQLYLDGQLVGMKEGIKISTINQGGFNGEFKFKWTDDFGSAIEAEVTLVRKGLAITQVEQKGLKSGETVDSLELLRLATPGDALVISLRYSDTTKFLNVSISK